jgi:hypothetical protein
MVTRLSENMRLDPGSEISNKLITDSGPGVKKSPGSGSEPATPANHIHFYISPETRVQVQYPLGQAR